MVSILFRFHHDVADRAAEQCLPCSVHCSSCATASLARVAEVVSAHNLFWRLPGTKPIWQATVILQESGFPLEARVGIEAVRRFKQSTTSLREKPEIKGWKWKAGSGGCWLLHFAVWRISETGICRQDPP
jgi:hypothetical protein